MKVTLLIVMIFYFVQFSIGQIDTVVLETEETALNFSQCKKILFGYRRTLTYPTNGKWTKADSAFIKNSDTIYFQIRKNGTTRIEGNKTPDFRAIREIKFYNSKSRLIKSEIWVEVIDSIYNNEVMDWGEDFTWQAKRIFKQDETEKIIIRTIDYSDKKGWQKTTKIYKYANNEIWPLRVKSRKI